MSDRIQIDVMINGDVATLADVSLETLTGMRDKAMPTVEPVKPIEHGDYGLNGNDSRLFVRNHKTGKIDAWDKYGNWTCDDVNTVNHRHWYTTTGNIFKDMQEKRDGS